ncbi:organic cation transporter protein-like [Liolophura sinensis]|uniref:organic cation transporter protein-like n=1 Tax=Liolophura sinensis TaxID=3198878 RepID=UPI00315859B3
MDFDEVFELLGEFGPYQKRIYFFLCVQVIACACQTFSVIFTGAIPHFRCSIPGLDNDTYEIQDENHQELVDAYIPVKLGKLGEEYQSCSLYNHYNTSVGNWSTVGNLTQDACYDWVYDKSIFRTTVTEEMGLVCNNIVKRSHLPMFYILGSLFGSFGIGTLSDWFGRKTLLYITIIGQLVVGTASAWVTNFTALALCRFMLGISGVGCFLAGFSLGMELVAPSKRVWTGIIIEVFYTFGEMLLAGVAYFVRDWRYLQMAISLPAILFLPYWWIIPESPRWLLTKGRRKQAYAVIQKAAVVNKVRLPPGLLDRQVQVKEAPKSKIWLLFSRKILLVRSVVLFFNWCVCSLVYYGLTLNSGYLYGDLHLNFFLSVLTEFISYCLCIPLLDRLGRRTLHCSAMLTSGLACCSTILTVLYLPEDRQWVTTILAMVGKLGASAAFAVVFIYSSEIFPTILRSGGVGIGSMFARIGALAAPYIADLGVLIGGNLGLGLPLLVFGLGSVAAGAAALTLPETLNRPLPETIEDAVNLGRKFSSERNGTYDVHFMELTVLDIGTSVEDTEEDLH